MHFTNTSYCQERNMNIGWFSLHTLPNKSVLGYSQDNHWVVVSNTEMKIIGSEKSYLYLLNVLEEPLEKFKIKLNNQITNEQIPEFPYLELIRFTLKEGSAYWIELALNWIDGLLNHEKQVLIELLNSIMKNNKYSQKLRHRTQKVIKRIDIL
ncbi:hypothetical protein [Cohnella luojiensis]|uniref:Uncharacterized protein n=1 Tax=Cohnella luojiensis TaxID=652876 RepID=A0A4Y8LMU2_9BACL|nr:hypothetical protein [Cohnella luojiensis]TFE19167.1 hypothetical protein E2980_23715 [Cohnella luojiensis]